MNHSWIRHLMLLPTRHLLRKLRKQFLDIHSGLIDLKLFTFDEVAETILLECDIPYIRLTPFARRKLVQRLLEEHRERPELRLFQQSSLEGGLISAVIHQIGELKRAGVSPAEWKNRIDRYPNERSEAIAFLYEKYQEALYVNPARWLLDAEEMLIAAHGLLLKEPRLFPRLQQMTIAHFTDFTPLQLKLLFPLIDKSDYVEIRFPFHPRRLEALPHLQQIQVHILEELKKRGLVGSTVRSDYGESLILHKSTEGWEEVSVASALQGPSATDELKALQEAWMLPVSERLSLFEGVELLPAADPQREIEAVALEVKRLILEEGISPDDIALIVRDEETYGAGLQRIFQNMGVGVNRDDSISFLEVPWVKEFLALCRLSERDWHRHALVALSQSVYITWDHPPEEGFLHWAMESGMVQGKEEWKHRIRQELRLYEDKIVRLEKGETGVMVAGLEEDHTTPEEIEQQRSVYEKRKSRLASWYAWMEEIEERIRFISVDTPQPVPFWIRQVHLLSNNLCLETGEMEPSRWRLRDDSAWEQLQISIDQLQRDMELSYGSRSCNWSQFLSDAESLWKDTYVLQQKGSQDGVRILDPSGARGDRFHTVFVLGMNEGRFPVFHREQWLFNDADRWLYSEEDEYRLPASHFHNEMEVLFLWLVAALPRERLILSYVSPEMNEKMLLSPFLEWLLENTETGPWLSPVRFSHALQAGFIPKNKKHVAQSGHLLRWHLFQSKIKLDHFSKDERQRLEAILSGRQIESSRYHGSFGRWDGKLGQPEIHEELSRLFSEERPYSTSFINEYAKDAFLFFLKRVLRIQTMEEKEDGLTAAEKGSLLHEVLRRMLMEYRGRSMRSDSYDQVEAKLSDCFIEVCNRWEEYSAVRLHPLWSLEKELMWKQCQRWLAFEWSALEKSSLRPVYLEFSFGLPLDAYADPESKCDPIILSIGQQKLAIQGRIDRVDRAKDGSFVIYDYKTSLNRNRGSSDIEKGHNFQLPLYLKAFEQWLTEEKNDSSAAIGAGFYSLEFKEVGRKAGIWSKESAAEVGLSSRNGGVVEDLSALTDEAMWKIPKLLTAIRQGQFHITPKHIIESFFADNAVYRIDKVRLYQRWKSEQQGRNSHGMGQTSAE
jgi:ATP-dependent helicase/nuclease subunit B